MEWDKVKFSGLELHALICLSWSLISILNGGCLLMDQEEKGGWEEEKQRGGQQGEGWKDVWQARGKWRMERSLDEQQGGKNYR